MNRTLAFALLALTACGQTSGKRVRLETKLDTDLPGDRTVETSLGWTVTIDRALISTGALYYFDGEPAFTQARPPSVVETIYAALSPIGTAYAHPGHYVSGTTQGQQLSPFTADLLAGEAALPAGEGISGLFRSGTFSFAAPTAGPVAAQLAGHVALVSGTATKEGKTVHFEAAADMADIERTAKGGEVSGCTFAEADVEGDGIVHVTVSPRVWFNLVDFSELAEGSAESPSIFAPDSTARIAFALGLTQLSAYEMAFSSP